LSDPSQPSPRSELPPGAPSEDVRDWVESLDDLVAAAGPSRTADVLRAVLDRASRLGVGLPPLLTTPYLNTIPADQEPHYPGDEGLERRIDALMRWNAMAMVVRANLRSPGIGGHLASYASAAAFYEVGLHHFFRGRDDGPGDQVFWQPQIAPAIYVRAWLEGRLTEAQLDGYRREVGGRGLPSYPHPRTMPDFWEFPNASMGLGPVGAIYQARFNRYLHNRGLRDTSGSRVWGFPGDGEMDEPEARGALFLAAQEGLDNLTLVINCNLQRLDGPVRGNGQLVQELEALFTAAGWNVLKVLWASEWDDLLARDRTGVLRDRLGRLLDGELQTLAARDGAYVREHLFGPDPELRRLVGRLSDEALAGLRRGGHDHRKLYAAYRAAVEHRGRPSVILALTVKGYGLGSAIQARNITHQAKRLAEGELRAFRDRLELPIPDARIGEVPYYHPGPGAPEVAYLLERRRALGGLIPRRLVPAVSLPAPRPAVDADLIGGSRLPASTMAAFARLLRNLLRDPGLGPRIVPIIPDEARTFGLDPLFNEFGIYAATGQQYEPVDGDVVLRYRESRDGQVLQEGITEAGSTASFQAAATSYATHGYPMIPFYIFYSMFGFQRTGDQLWQLGDARARGFLIGGIAGRTTLNGEGIQHQDGTSQVIASTWPGLRQYDPAYAYELAVIVRDGIDRMHVRGEEVFYYITLYNESYPQPARPEGVDEGIVRGLYRVRAGAAGPDRRVGLIGSGSLLNQALHAAEILEVGHGVAADVWSATSFGQLRREAVEEGIDPPWVAQQLGGHSAQLYVGLSDFTHLWPEQIRPWVPGRYLTLGPEGWGMCDTREALRELHGLTGEALARRVVEALADDVGQDLAAGRAGTRG
jgi:pyruvate dehydrogenase E1 component